MDSRLVFLFLTYPQLMPSSIFFFFLLSRQLCYAASRGDVQSLRLLIDCAGLEASLIVLWQYFLNEVAQFFHKFSIR